MGVAPKKPERLPQTINVPLHVLRVELAAKQTFLKNGELEKSQRNHKRLAYIPVFRVVTDARWFCIMPWRLPVEGDRPIKIDSLRHLKASQMDTSVPKIARGGMRKQFSKLLFISVLFPCFSAVAFAFPTTNLSNFATAFIAPNLHMNQVIPPEQTANNTNAQSSGDNAWMLMSSPWSI